jgi:mannose-6-phosphate isomerase
MLETRVVEKPWGVDLLPPPFVDCEGRRIGEIWFEPPPEMPKLLVKYLFTSETLSVQVHPSDEEAPAGNRGKDECWLILAAEPGARIATGFKDSVSRSAMRTAALDGSIEHLLQWHEVQSDDFVYLPAGTVHAIGAGISLIEVQQNSDITYRLYDYGRPRELHLEQGIAIADGGPHPPGLRRHLPMGGAISLVDGPYFRLDRLQGVPDARLVERYADAPLLVIPLDAPARLGELTIEPGGCAVTESLSALKMHEEGRALIAQQIERDKS